MNQVIVTFAKFRTAHSLHHADALVFQSLVALPQYQRLRELAALAGCRKPHLLRSLKSLTGKGLVVHVDHGRYVVEPGVLGDLTRQCGMAA